VTASAETADRYAPGGLAARRFPLTPRPKPPCRPLEQRLDRAARLAGQAQTRKPCRRPPDCPTPLKARKDRYAGAVHQVAVRILHEIFEADRGGKISPGRETFSHFDLANVVPRATLDHLGAAVSKSPFDLTPADTSHGVRVRRQ